MGDAGINFRVYMGSGNYLKGLVTHMNGLL